MKALHSWLLLGIVAFLSANPTSAQIPPSLSLRLFAGVNITGTVGNVYVVQSSSDLSQTDAWTSLAFVQLPSTNYLFVDTSAPVAGNRFYRALLQSPPTNMVFIPPNTFELGSPTNEVGRASDEGPQTAVIITHGFWMGKYEVTQREYLGVVGANPSFFVGDPNRPVETVSWLDATNYCAKLTEQDLAAGRIPPGSHYRLPTEAEWEYACRAGTTTPYFFGDDASKLSEYAWYEQNSDFKYQKVGKKKPNPWGLYDIYGNVVEWVLDQYDPDFYKQCATNGEANDPWNKATKPYPHSARGGSWDDDAGMCRSDVRRGSDRSWKMQDPQLPKSVWYFSDAQWIGFRIVRPLKVPPPEVMQKYWTSGVERD
jgi:formylglycine-generating enzyme required for sulfatase activity